MTQGESHKITIGIDRGSDFTQPVSMTLTSSEKGLSIDPANPNIAANESKVDVTLTAAEDATIGLTTISLIGEPSSGKSVDGSIQVRITEKKKQ